MQLVSMTISLYYIQAQAICACTAPLADFFPLQPPTNEEEQKSCFIPLYLFIAHKENYHKFLNTLPLALSLLERATLRKNLYYRRYYATTPYHLQQRKAS